jgi:cyclase
MRVIAGIQITKDGAVKTQKFEKKIYLGDPVNIVRILNEKGAQEIAIFDIASTISKQIDYNFVQSISEELYIPVSYGGGINSDTNISDLKKLGVERLILGSLYIQDVKSTKLLSDVFGSSSISASIDILSFDQELNLLKLSLNGMTNFTTITVENLFEVLDLSGVGEIIFRHINFDGMKNSEVLRIYSDLLLNSTVQKNLHKYQVLIGSGVYSHDILREVEDNLPIDGVILGSLICLTRNGSVLISYPTAHSIL